MKKIKIHNQYFTRLIEKKKIQKRINILAKEINKVYKNADPIFIGILNGSFYFMADILRKIRFDYEIDFLKISSYNDFKMKGGTIKRKYDLNCSLKNRNVIVIEDIVDSGKSIDFILKLIKKQRPKSIKIITLLLKDKPLKNIRKIDYIGFRIPDIFVIGYGLDYAQKGRNLMDIYGLTEKK